MTPKPQPLRPEDESERARPAATVPLADGSPPRAAPDADQERDERAAVDDTPLTGRGPDSSLSPTGSSAASSTALRRHARDDEALTEAITPLVTDALLVAVRRNPRVLVDALFPIILPAIRRAVTGMLRGLVQSINPRRKPRRYRGNRSKRGWKFTHRISVCVDRTVSNRGETP